MLRKDLDEFPYYRPGKSAEGKVKLSSNEADYAPPSFVQDAIHAAVQYGNRYGEFRSPELTTALAEYLGLSEDNLCVGPGASSIVQRAVRITCNTGDEVVFPWRSFEAYPLYVRMAGAVPVTVPLADDYSIDLHACAEAITEKTKLVILCNPNNPTGTTFSRAEFREFMDMIPDDLVVLIDEAYWEFNDDPDRPDAVQEIQDYPNLVGARTFSKAFGLAGMRVGYGFAQPELAKALNLVALPLAVTGMAEQAAIAALAHREAFNPRVEESKRQRDRIAQAIGAAPSQGNFVWLPRADAADVEQRIFDEGVIIRRYGDEGVRISVTSEQEADAFLNAWERAGLSKRDSHC